MIQFDRHSFQMGWFNHQQDCQVICLFFELVTPLKINMESKNVAKWKDDLLN